MESNMNLYEHYEQDNDLNYYPFMNKDVKYIDYNHIKGVDEIVKKYEDLIQQHYYILGNYLYFTYDGIKYYWSISNSTDEEKYINDIINDLQELGCYAFYYNPGYLD